MRRARAVHVDAAMLYRRATKTLIQVVPPAEQLSEERMRSLAEHQGRRTDDGEPVEKVALVFVGGKRDAAPHAGLGRRFGLELRYLDTSGEEHVLVPGGRVQSADSVDEDDRTLVPVLREQAWPHLDTVVSRRLLEGPGDIPGPFVTFGWDSPQTLARMAPEHLASSGRTLAEVERIACANLARRTFAPTLIRAGAVGVQGAEYCSEAILLPHVMDECAALLGCELMAVGVPKDNILIAVDAAAFEDVAKILATTREVFDEADGRRISPLPFLVGQGKAIGFVSPSTRPQTRSKKPWYKFW